MIYVLIKVCFQFLPIIYLQEVIRIIIMISQIVIDHSSTLLLCVCMCVHACTYACTCVCDLITDWYLIALVITTTSIPKSSVVEEQEKTKE